MSRRPAYRRGEREVTLGRNGAYDWPVTASLCYLQWAISAYRQAEELRPAARSNPGFGPDWDRYARALAMEEQYRELSIASRKPITIRPLP